MNSGDISVEGLASLCGAAAGNDPCRRTFVVLAHPDDETVAASSVLRQSGASTFVYVTDGAPRDGHDARAAGFPAPDAYADARRRELSAALALAGIDLARIHPLELSDQQASLHLAWLSRTIASLLCSGGAGVVLTHPYEGGHPDHDATAFAVHQACRLLESAGVQVPVIVEAACYHAGAEGQLVFGEFLPAGGEGLTVALDEDARAFKQRLIACHATQRAVLEQVRLDVERFRLAPHYDFTRRPHAGALLYDRFAWGMTSTRWLELASEALGELAMSSAAERRTRETEAVCP